MPDEDERRQALIGTGCVCIAQHDCTGPGCTDENHRRDMDYWREMARMLGLVQ